MTLLPNLITPEAARTAMEAHTNITMFGAIIALCESSLFHGERAQKIEERVVAMCQKEQQEQFTIMEKATGRDA